MGAGISVHETEQAARRRSKTIDDGLEADRLRQARTVRVLMLGLSGGGKSTLAKQVRLIHDQGFTDKEREFFRDLMRQNLAAAILTVLSAMDHHGIAMETEELKEMSSQIKQKLRAKTTSACVLDLQAPIIQLVSKAKSQVWEFLESHVTVEDCVTCGYLLRATERILSPSYVPNDLDILRARHKTTGMNEVVFNFKGLEFRLCDVDGHTSIKSKWLQNFDNVSAIIFCASLGSYVIKSKEKEDETELHDAVRAFNTVCQYKAFETTPILLFLNKSDVFQKQLTKSPLSAVFKDYKGKNDAESASEFIQSLFVATVEPKDRRLTSQTTNATDTAHITQVFEASLAVIVDNA